MSERPALDDNLDSTIFKSFYYLKEELVAFCKNVGLQTGGSKQELTDRIALFLDTGKIATAEKRKKRVHIHVGSITEDSLIEANFVCSEKHRTFFKQVVGPRFTFNTVFQKWLKENTGKSYGDAVLAYYIILEEKKTTKADIEKQFEYNTYIRDFFADNTGKSLDDAIKCWKYKKSLQGHNRYEKSDLIGGLQNENMGRYEPNLYTR